jgi:hypothetical protein
MGVERKCVYLHIHVELPLVRPHKSLHFGQNGVLADEEQHENCQPRTDIHCASVRLDSVELGEVQHWVGVGWV